MFNYLNVRVYDDEKTDLLKHWDDTFKYITRARSEGSKVLVHCKMGVSRSASVVIAYAMKAFGWEFKTAFDYVKRKRSCIKPNGSFVAQLETYQVRPFVHYKSCRSKNDPTEVYLTSTVSSLFLSLYLGKEYTL